MPCGIIGNRKPKHDGKPKEAGNNNQFGAAGAVLAVHKKQDHQRHFNGGYAESYNDIQPAKVHFRGLDS